MDFLSQYKQEHPEAFQEKKRTPITDEYGRVYTGMIAVVIRLSRGRIRDARTASYVLLGGAILIAIISLVLYFRSGTSGPSGRVVPVAGPNTQ
ncbi:MAG: hypothetical protein AAB915_01630 [Patescibacteria group bacterium]